MPQDDGYRSRGGWPPAGPEEVWVETGEVFNEVLKHVTEHVLYDLLQYRTASVHLDYGNVV